MPLGRPSYVLWFLISHLDDRIPKCIVTQLISDLYPVLSVIFVGSGYGLSLTLNLEEYENIKDVSTLTGIKV